MSFADERSAIEGRFAANYSSSQIKYENVPFDQPSSDPWISLEIISGEGGQASLGGASAVQRYGGVIQVTIYTAESVGTNVARALADVIEPIFRQQQFSQGNSGVIHTRTPSFYSIGLVGGWYRSVVSVSYFRDRRF